MQLLQSPGKSRYEQVTNTSIALRQLASRTKIVLLVLAQLSRGVEQRSGQFLPIMSDIKDSGQLEQDADVILFQCWPHQLVQTEPKDRYQFFVAKNRNRETRQWCVECRFDPDRQMFRGGRSRGSPIATESNAVTFDDLCEMEPRASAGPGAPRVKRRFAATERPPLLPVRERTPWIGWGEFEGRGFKARLVKLIGIHREPPGYVEPPDLPEPARVDWGSGLSIVSLDDPAFIERTVLRARAKRGGRALEPRERAHERNLSSIRAYGVAYPHLYDLMPECRGCACA